MLSELDRVRTRAKKNKKERFTALLHHVSPERLKAAYKGLNPRAAVGIDGVTWKDYGMKLEENIAKLHDVIHRGEYKAVPARRVLIPKPNGDKRPLGIVTLEEKVVQKSFTEVLNAIYEQDFLGFSYGFRPGRSPHRALDALTLGIEGKKINWILDADIEKYFDSIDHEWLMKFIEHRIGDKRILWLIKRWLKAGVLEEETIKRSEAGTPQGATISPLLANVYLHYVFDLWAHQWRRKHAKGDVILIRYADDIVAGFEHEAEARAFLEEMRTRLEMYKLKLHSEKTRILEFGRYAAKDRRQRGKGKPETFQFLGFTHICDQKRNGRFFVRRKTDKKRMKRKLKAIKQQLKRCMHVHVDVQGAWLKMVLTGHNRYYGVPGNIKSLYQFRFAIVGLWRRILRRRGQKRRTTWESIRSLANRWLPKPMCYHQWPSLPHRV